MATVTTRQVKRGFVARLTPELGWKTWAIRHVWIVPILAVAAWLRFAGLGGTFLFGDSAEYSIVARYLSHDATYLAYPNIEALGAAPFVSQPPLLLYMMAISMKVFGPTELGAMFPSLLLGTATVLVVYALGCRLGGRTLGLSAAAVLAVMPFHIEWTRKAMLDAGYVFFIVLTAYFLVAWLQERKTRQAVGVGVAAACAALSKLPGMLAGVAVAAILAYALVLALAKRDITATRKIAKDAAWGALPVAVGAGLYLGLLVYLQSVQNLWIKLLWQLGRVNTGQGSAQDMGAVTRAWWFYFTDAKFSFAAEMSAAVLTLALIGGAVALYRFARHPVRQPEHAVPLVFVGVLLAFFLYSARKEGFYLLPFAPFVALGIGYAADGLRRMLSWAGARVESVRPRAALVAVCLAALLVVMPAYANAGQAYNKFVLGKNPENDFGSGTKEAAYWIHDHDPHAAQYGSVLGRFTLYYYDQQPTYHWYVDHTFVEQQAANGKLQYVVYDEYLGQGFDTQYMQELIAKFHGQKVAEFRGTEGWGDVKVFELHP